MYRPLPLAALLLLLLSIAPTGAEVVESMADCEEWKEFFLDKTPPVIQGILEGGKILKQNQNQNQNQNQDRYKLICQTFQNKRRFVTLYDTENKIPVFSAYKYIGTDSTRPQNPIWKIEPQLENTLNDKNMKTSSQRSNHQATDADYTNNNQRYHRGHLFPCFHASSKEDKESTFTLTNAVPQAGKFNIRSWKKMEADIKFYMDELCKNNNNNDDIEAFLVTGAQPSTNTIIGNKVNVPSMLWSAFCCYSRSEGTWLASAHWGKNVEDSSKDLRLPTKTLRELSKELSTPNSAFEVFPGTQCPLDTVVTLPYTELKKDKGQKRKGQPDGERKKPRRRRSSTT